LITETIMLDENGIRALLPEPRVQQNIESETKKVRFADPVVHEFEQSSTDPQQQYDSYLDKPLFDTDEDHPLKSRKPAVVPNGLDINEISRPPPPRPKHTAVRAPTPPRTESSRFFIYMFSIFSVFALVAICLYVYNKESGPGEIAKTPKSNDIDAGVNDLLRRLR